MLKNVALVSRLIFLTIHKPSELGSVFFRNLLVTVVKDLNNNSLFSLLVRWKTFLFFFLYTDARGSVNFIRVSCFESSAATPLD